MYNHIHRNLILYLAYFVGAKFNNKKSNQKVPKKFPKISKIHKSCQILKCLVLAHFFLLKINFHCRISMPDLIFGFGITWRWIHTDLFVIPYWVGCISHIIRYFIGISKYDSAVKIELSDLFICLGWLIFLIITEFLFTWSFVST